MPRNAVLGIIPARKGSKRIVHKNTADVAGKPLIAWTIMAARAARCLERIIVSTDCPEIAAVSREHGAEVPFARPEELSQDDTPGPSVLTHALDWLELNDGYRPGAAMFLQPTSPLRTAEDIDASFETLERNSADAVVSVTAMTGSPSWMRTISGDGRLTEFVPQLPAPGPLRTTYMLNGAIYLVRRDVFRRNEHWYTPNTFAYVMPQERSLDIDTPWDLHLAHLILAGRRDD